MIKRFVPVVSILSSLFLVIVFYLIQSHSFATVLRQKMVHFFMNRPGIQVNFSDLKIQFSPLCLQIHHPEFILNHQKESQKFHAKLDRVEIHFGFFQLFSKHIRAKKISFMQGMIQIYSPQSKTPAQPFHLNNHLLNFLKTESIHIQKVHTTVQIKPETTLVQGFIQDLVISQDVTYGPTHYNLEFDIDQLSGEVFNHLPFLESLTKARGQLLLMVNKDSTHLKIKFISLADPHQQGWQATLQGNILNFLQPERSWDTNLVLKFSGKLKPFTAFLPKKTIFDGKFLSSFHIFGPLSPKNFTDLKSIRASTEIHIEDLSFKDWSVQKTEIHGTWDGSSQTPWTLSKAVFSTPEKPRQGGFQPGTGGTISVGPLHGSLEPSQTLDIPIYFQHSHLHWLASPAIRLIYPVDLRISGSSLIHLKLSNLSSRSPWAIHSHVDFELEKFQFDNQRYLKEKNLKLLFQIPKVYCDGNVNISPEKVSFEDFFVRIHKTQLNLQGHVHFKKGYHLTATGPIHLEELKTIAEQEISGTGQLNLQVQGPSSNVFINAFFKLKDTYYLKMNFDTLEGSIIWDDDRNLLKLHQIQWGESKNTAIIDGQLDLDGSKEAIQVHAHIQKTEMRHLTQLVSEFLRPLTYFPREMNGLITGDVDILGGIQSSTLIVRADLTGTDLEHWDEHFHSGHLLIRYDRGHYFVDHLQLNKQQGLIRAHLSLNPQQIIHWDLETQNLLLNHWDHIANLGVPIRGYLDWKSEGHGKLDAIRSRTTLHLSHHQIGGLELPSSQINLVTNDEGMYWTGSLFDDQFYFNWNDSFQSEPLSQFHLRWKKMNFIPFLWIFNPKLIREPSLTSSTSGSISLRFPQRDLRTAHGTLQLSEWELKRNDHDLRLNNPVSFSVRRGYFDTEQIQFKGKLGKFSLKLQNQDHPNSSIKGNFQSQLKLSLLELLSPNILQANGVLHGHWDLSGSWEKPQFSGNSSVDQGMLQLSGIESILENISATLSFKQNEIQFKKIHADLGGGSIEWNGSLHYFPNRLPDILAHGSLEGAKLKIFPFQYLQLKGGVDYQTQEGLQQLKGHLFVDSALLKEKILYGKRSASAKNLPYAPPIDQMQNSYFKNLTLNLLLTADRGLWVQNDIFRDLELKGRVQLLNTLQHPKLSGTLESLQGKLFFKDHIFQIQNAKARFNPSNSLTPLFDLSATTEIDSVKIQLFAAGQADGDWKLQFTSNPMMPESEILSLLTSGLSPNSINKLKSVDRNTLQQGEATSLLLHSLNFNRDFEEKTGFQVQLDESMNSQQGASAFRPQAQTETTAAPQIKIRKQLGNRFSFSAGSTVGVGTYKQNQLNLDYSVNPNLSVSGVFINYGSNETADTQLPALNSIGLDLKFNKRFK